MSAPKHSFPSSQAPSTPMPQRLTVEQEFAQAASDGAANARGSTTTGRPERSSKRAAKRKISAEDDDEEDDTVLAQPVPKKAKKTSGQVVPVATAATQSIARPPSPQPQALDPEAIAAAHALMSLATVPSRASSPSGGTTISVSSPDSSSRDSSSLAATSKAASPPAASPAPPSPPRNQHMAPLPLHPHVPSAASYAYTHAVNDARAAAEIAANRAASTYGKDHTNAVFGTDVVKPKLKPADVIADVRAVYGSDPTLWNDETRRLFGDAERRIAQEANRARQREEDAARRARLAEEAAARQEEEREARNARAAARR